MIYFDNAATTAVSEAAAKASYEVMTEQYGNPSSVHDFGFSAEMLLKKSRAQLLKTIGSVNRNDDFFFTSGGTEANNLAVLGIFNPKRHTGKKFFFSDSEHASVFALSNHLAENGCIVKYIPTKNGKVDLDFCEKEFDKATVFISCMSANNETGAIYDISSLSKIRKSKCPDAILHTDAVQAFGKLENLVSCGADLISVSGHKVHAPKGIGGLYVKAGTKLKPIIFGGGQEKNIRPGTEALPLIVALSKACENFSKNNYEYVQSLYKHLESEIQNKNIPVKINKPEKHLPHVVSLTLPSIKSEVMLRRLSADGICISAGSACTSKHRENRVLAAFGLSSHDADCTVRISFSEYNTKNEIDLFIKHLSSGIESLVKIK